MRLSPDQWVFWQEGVAKLNATIVFTWVVMAILVGGSWLVSRRLQVAAPRSRWQHVLEVVVTTAAQQIAEAGLPQPRRYLPFIASLFLFIATAALLTIVPGYEPPTASLSTTVALAAVVFVTVPSYGVRTQGWRAYLRSYLGPTPLMLPFNIISELSRTLALSVRLFGNMMSGTMIVGILVTIAPFLFPVVMTTLGLLTGLVQAYIFSVLATVYLAGATQSAASTRPATPEPEEP